MQLARLALALAVSLAACGGGQHAAKHDDDDDGPFVDRADFKPTAFKVAVHGKGRAVIFIPGLGCPGDMFDDVVEHLGDRYQSHVLTLAGFAGVPPIKPPLAAKTRRDLIRYIRSQKLDHPIIVGHSFGGFIAYWLGETVDDLGGVVVVDASPGLVADDEEARLLRNAWAQAGDDELPVQIRAAFMQMTHAPAKMQPFLPTIAKSDRQTIGDAIYEYVKTDITDEVEKIKAPFLLILADGGLAARYTKSVADIPNKQIVKVDGAGHFVWFDKPDGFNRALDDFLARVTSHDEK